MNLTPPPWANEDNTEFSVARLLVGDCNLTLGDGLTATQDLSAVPVTALQKKCGLGRWEVVSTSAGKSGDIMFFPEDRHAARST